MTTISNRRSLCIVPTLWQQDLVSGKDAQSAENVRSMSICARAAWPNHWFHDRSLYDITFSVDLLKTKLDEQRLPELEGAIGVLKYYSGTQGRSVREEELKPFISGGLRIDEELFYELWERVKQRVVFPCDIRLEVDGVTRDPLLMGDDYWDVTSQPNLAVFSVKFCFYTEQANPPLSEGINS